MILAVAEAILIHPLVVGRPVKFQLLRGLVDESQFTAGLQTLIILLIEVVVIDKSFQTTIEARYGKGKFLRGTMVMSYLDVAPETRTDAQTNIRTLVVHRVLRVDTHQSALGVLSVERTLRATQDVYAIEHIEMVVERGFRHQWDVIIIDTHSRIIDARANTANIHRRGESRAIRWHHK